MPLSTFCMYIVRNQSKKNTSYQRHALQLLGLSNMACSRSEWSRRWRWQANRPMPHLNDSSLANSIG